MPRKTLWRWAAALRGGARALYLSLLRRCYPTQIGGLHVVRIRSGPIAGRRMLLNLRATQGLVDTPYINGYPQEAEELSILAGLIRPGQTVWDVGIYRGVYTLLFSGCVGAEGRVIAIDIDRRNCRVVEETLRLNGIDNVTVRNYGLSNENGSAEFISSPSSNSRVLTTFRGEAVALSALTPGECIERGEMRTIDGLIDELGHPDVVKIDIDGAELVALDAADRLFESADTVLVIESHNAATDRKVTDLLTRHGCIAYSIQQHRVFAPAELMWGTVVAARAAGRLSYLPRAQP